MSDQDGSGRLPSRRARLQPCTLAEQLLQRAQEVPNARAVALEGRSLSYGELAREALGIAALLQAHGVRRGDRVGVCLLKSPEAVSAWFGTLLAGAAYVPLDPASPVARLRAIGAQAEWAALIAHGGRPELAEASGGAPVIWDREVPGARHLGEGAGAPRPVALTDLDLAYVYFTSGSTGTPKGVAISHRASLAYLEAADRILAGAGDDVIANHSPLFFDVASLDVHFAVRAGATVHLVPEPDAAMPGAFARWLTAAQPTVLFTVPSMLRRLAELPSLATYRFPALRALIFSGEPPHPPSLRALRAVFPKATLHHWYGSTEAALMTAASFPPEAAVPDVLPIGTAVSNVDVARSDEGGAPAAWVPGTEGELLVSGTTLLDGYCNDPGRTAEAFVLAAGPGQLARRWFRTRDHVRCGPDGQLSFVCRLDRMVKVGGVRVDLGEVEAAIERAPGVREAAVIAVGDPVSGCRLWAFAAGDARSAEELGAALRDVLPAHMLPARIELRPSLPRTATGKLDRPALARLAEALV
ncbi:MAG TPA: amino acid adenylation domain-containing protein [Myxococcaceae bacterium]|jgi:amino acid adenylation domain-containing protein